MTSSTNLKDYQKKFLQLAIEMDVLQFGDFILKSGKKSPYFFNAGKFNSSKAITVLGQCYAQAFIDHAFEADVVFGPAYKGIPMAVSCVNAMYSEHNIDCGYAFNRKEAKSYGDGGVIVGSAIAGKRVIILDDVVTAGTAIRESIAMIEAMGGTVSGVLLAFDRAEKMPGSNHTAIESVSEQLNANAINKVKVQAIASLHDMLTLLESMPIYAEQAELIKEHFNKVS